MDLRDQSDTLLSDYSDFGDEFADLLAMEIADAVSTRIATPVRDVAPPSLTNAIERYLDNIAISHERAPEEVGAMQEYARKSAINSALVLAIAKTVRHCARNTARAPALLQYVAIRSDNKYGRCVDSADRIADYLSCGEDVVRHTRTALVACGALRRDEAKPGLPDVLWLPYAEEAFQNSAFAVLNTMAPPRLNRGRPKKPEHAAEKTPGVGHPTFLEKPRVSVGKTSGLQLENPGCLTPDIKNSSLQELITRNKGETRAREEAPSASPINFKEEVKDGVAHLEHAMRAQNFGSPPKESANWYAWRDHLSRSALVRAVSKDEAFELASVSRSKADYWPAASQIIKATEMRAERLQDRDRRLAEYERKKPRFDEWQRQTQVAVKIREATYAETPDGQGCRELVLERMRAAGINLHEFEADQFNFPPSQPVKPSEGPIPFVGPDPKTIAK